MVMGVSLMVAQIVHQCTEVDKIFVVLQRTDNFYVDLKSSLLTGD